MLSRVAENVYWMGRYLERAGNVARILDVNYHLVLDSGGYEIEQWEPMTAITGDHAQFMARYHEATVDNVIQFLAFDPQNPNSIQSCLRKARDNARLVRETISSEMWRQVNQFSQMVDEMARGWRSTSSPHELFTRIKLANHLYEGVTDATMSHGEAWRFHQIGRLLERADKTARLLDVKYFILLPSVEAVGSPLDELQWSAVLRSVDGLEMYRQKFGRISLRRVVEFLLLDREFPAAVNYCVATTEDFLHSITGTPAGRFSNAAEEHTGRLRTELAEAGASSVLIEGLHEFLNGLQGQLNRVGDELFSTFFAPEPTGPMAQNQ